MEIKKTSYTCDELRAKGVDTSKLQFPGALNYIVQASIDRETGDIFYDQYQPRKNRVWSGVNDMTEDELKREMAETIERMKIAMILMQDFIDGKSDNFYYWEASDEHEFINKFNVTELNDSVTFFFTVLNLKCMFNNKNLIK